MSFGLVIAVLNCLYTSKSQSGVKVGYLRGPNRESESTYNTELPDCGRFAGLVGLGTGLFGIWNKEALGKLLVCLGHGFCGVRPRIFHEVWVTDSAWCFGRNVVWECGLSFGVLVKVWDGTWEGCAESAAGGFDEGVEHAFPDCFGWSVDAGGSQRVLLVRLKEGVDFRQNSVDFSI